VRLPHHALPEVDKASIRLATTFLGRRLKPLCRSPDDRRRPEGQGVQRSPRAAAAAHGIAMGVGSQRAAIENPKLADTYAVILDHDVPLRMANLACRNSSCGRRRRRPRRDGPRDGRRARLVHHLNFLQEAVQPEGDTGAKALAAIRRIAATSRCPSS